MHQKNLQLLTQIHDTQEASPRHGHEVFQTTVFSARKLQGLITQIEL